MAVGIVGVIGATNSSFRVAGSANGRSKAVAIATKETEELRAVPYDDLVAGSGTVTTEQINVDGVTFNVEKGVNWAADGSVTRAYKEGVVSVAWTDNSGSHEVHQSTYVYPGGIGPVVTTSSSTTVAANCTPAAPLSLVAAAPVDVTQAPSVADLAWTYVSTTCQAETFIIQYSTNNFATQNEITRTATAIAYRVTGLSASTSYKFRVAARSAAGRQSTWSPVASITTAAATQPACQLGSLSVSPSSVNKRSAAEGSGLEVDPLLELPTSGTCNGFYAIYRPTSTSTQRATLVVDATKTYRATLNGRTIAWDVGKRFVDIHDAATNAKVGSVLLTVCEHNVTRCA